MKKIIILITMICSLLSANEWQKYETISKWTEEKESGIRFIDTSGVSIQIENCFEVGKILEIKMPVRLKKNAPDYYNKCYYDIYCKVGQYNFTLTCHQDDTNDFLFWDIIEEAEAISFAISSDISFSIRLVDETGKEYSINLQ